MQPAICIECLLLVEANWVFTTPLRLSSYLREEMMYTELQVTWQRSISYAMSTSVVIRKNNLISGKLLGETLLAKELLYFDPYPANVENMVSS
jgi:hypothetical protein